MKTITTDFLVVGSGSGGMVGAITAHELGMETILIEKSKYYGGSSAMSGGGIWAPNNPTLRRHGIEDSVEDIVTYMRAVTEGLVPDEKLIKYAKEGGQLFEMLEQKSEYMRFIYADGYSDYHPDYPKGRPEGRTIEAVPFDLNKLKEDKKYIHPIDIAVPKGMYLTAKEFKRMSMMARTWDGFKMAMKVSLRTAKNLLLFKDVNALGLSLMGRLRMVMKENNIPLWLNTALNQLTDEHGRITGAIVEKDGEKIQIIANKGVLLATGGFDHKKKYRKEHLPEVAQEDFSAGAPENVGDALGFVEKYNVALEFMDDAWWMPSVKLPNGKMFTLVSERAIPRSIIVGDDGKRFTNESSPYVNFVHDQIDAGWKTVWQILDQKAINRYMYAAKPPMIPFGKKWYKNGTIFKAKTPEALADKIGIDKDNFIATIHQYNLNVKDGKDDLFGRGDNAYDRYYGDPTLKNPVLDYLDKPPYYAIKVRIGDLGTKGGLKTDHNAKVINTQQEVIPGLYATGNVSGSVMGRDYAGAGGTIGPAMIFGYVAAKDAAKSL